MYHFEPREIDCIGARLRLLIEAAEEMSKKKGVIISYEQFSTIIDHTILHESLMTELCDLLIEQKIIIVSLGANFLILDAKEVIKYKKLTPTRFEKIMSRNMVLF
mgnify:CR=1 FL=1